MKIAYIGTSDQLAETLAERMVQEGHDVYLLSDKAFPQKVKSVSLHRFYRRPRKSEAFGKLLRSISPDCVVFAGNSYIGSSQEESDEDVALLTQTLRTAAAFPKARFILLSSTEVYGNTVGRADESAECAAVNERGIRFIREEQLLDIYRKQYGMDAVILRASQLYSDCPEEAGNDFLSRRFSAAARAEKCMTADVFQPLHVCDLVDAVKRAADAGEQYIYNVCGSAEISAEHLHRLVCWQQNFQESEVRWEEPGCVTLADSELIRRELGWRDSRNLEEQLRRGEITYKRAKAKSRGRKKWSIPTDIRRMAENLVLFEVFCFLDSLCSGDPMFSQINWLLIYVILISVFYNIYQSALAAVLASAAYLYSKGLSILEMTTFYTYADTVLAFVQFVTLGLIVSYTASAVKRDAWSARLDLDILKEEYEDLKAVNEENVLIKNEYEERLLTSKTGFPKLYDLISHLMVQEPDRILMETMQVISELVRTDTVAVYQGQAGSPWLRLAGALGENSVMNGKSWNLSDFPHIYNAIVRGELYQGEMGSGEPAVVLPIVCGGVPRAVILIKTMRYECETLYHINLLKTLSLLLRDSMERALQYEELSREEQYIKGTDILKPEAFRKRVQLAGEKAEKRMAEYCLVELAYPGSMTEAAVTVSQKLRVTDCIGTDGEGKLFALLNNTGPENLEYLQNRLLTCGIKARSIMEEASAIVESLERKAGLQLC